MTFGQRIDIQTEETMEGWQGAYLERGYVAEAEGSRYRVASYDRQGVTTPPIGSFRGDTFSVGDQVIFVLWPDGSGKILGNL